MATLHDLPQDDPTLTIFPEAPDDQVGLRWQEARRRRRMLEGLWREDLDEILDQHMAKTRQRRQGPPDMTKNVFKSIVLQLSVLYDRPPRLKHESSDAVDQMTVLLNNAGTWPLSMRLQQLVTGQREAARVFMVRPDGTVQVENVPADLAHAVASPDAPDEPHTFYRYRIRELEGKEFWTRDCWSIEDLDNPFFRVESEDGETDLSSDFGIEGWSGESYRCRLTQGADAGKPVLPVVLYHASRTGRLWDPWTGIEVVEGSLRIAMLWTMWSHVVKDASWPQRYMVNLRPAAGGETSTQDGENVVEADPAAVLQLEMMRPGVATVVGQWGPGGDPDAIGKAIRDYSADLSSDFDVSADVQRVHADARSGYAIEITRQGQRDAQRRAEPNFRRGDQQFLSAVAACSNGIAGTNLPEDNWDLEYGGVPLSLEERRVMVEEFKVQDELGLTSTVELRALLKGTTIEQAREELRQIRADRAEFGVVT